MLWRLFVFSSNCKTLHPYLVHQLTWGRFINAHGGKGRNIPCDLHNEHINGLFKDIVCNMGSNFTQEASTRAARSVTSLERIAKMFEVALVFIWRHQEVR